MRLYTIACNGAQQAATRAAWGFVHTPDSYRPSRCDGRPELIDAATWAAYVHKSEWSEERYRSMLRKLPPANDRMFVLPDVVMDSAATERRSEEWYQELRGERLLYAVQQGYDDATLRRWLARGCGLFIGGDKAFKVREAPALVRLAAGAWVHMGRVNSPTRIVAAVSAGCSSIDGASPVRFPSTRVTLEAAAARPVQMRFA